MDTTSPEAAASSARPALRSRFNAAIYEPFLALGERRGSAARRRSLLSDLSGDVLEIGAGTGLNLPHYPPSVRLVLTEPDPGMLARLRRRAPSSVRVVPAPAESLWFPDESFDAVVSTLVLCTVPDPAAALSEMVRVLRPGGRLALLEHVLADPGRLARRQHRMAGPWAGFAAGCRCDQDTGSLLRAAGFDTDPLGRARWRGMPSIVRPLLVGTLPRPA